MQRQPRTTRQEARLWVCSAHKTQGAAWSPLSPYKKWERGPRVPRWGEGKMLGKDFMCTLNVLQFQEPASFLNCGQEQVKKDEPGRSPAPPSRGLGLPLPG